MIERMKRVVVRAQWVWAWRRCRCAPGGVPTGYTYFIPQEEHLESRVVTRNFMEAKMTVGMAGRCARVPDQAARHDFVRPHCSRRLSAPMKPAARQVVRTQLCGVCVITCTLVPWVAQQTQSWLRRCAERLVLGEANITTAGAGDLEQVNNIAREMVRAPLLGQPHGFALCGHPISRIALQVAERCWYILSRCRSR